MRWRQRWFLAIVMLTPDWTLLDTCEHEVKVDTNTLVLAFPVVLDSRVYGKVTRE